MATSGDRHPDAFLITDAPESYEEQHRARVRKYLQMMAFRVPALLFAALAYSVTGSGLLALAIIAGSIPLPWVAVLIANDRPPRKRGERPSYKRGTDGDLFGPQGLSTTAQALAAGSHDPTQVSHHVPTVGAPDVDEQSRRGESHGG